jgi:hypothetical protein
MIQQEGKTDPIGLRCLVGGSGAGSLFRASTREQPSAWDSPVTPAIFPMAASRFWPAVQPRPWSNSVTGCGVGPPQAQVTAVASEFVPCQPLSGFSTR